MKVSTSEKSFKNACEELTSITCDLFPDREVKVVKDNEMTHYGCHDSNSHTIYMRSNWDKHALKNKKEKIIFQILSHEVGHELDCLIADEALRSPSAYITEHIKKQGGKCLKKEWKFVMSEFWKYINKLKYRDVYPLEKNISEYEEEGLKEHFGPSEMWAKSFEVYCWFKFFGKEPYAFPFGMPTVVFNYEIEEYGQMLEKIKYLTHKTTKNDFSEWVDYIPQIRN